LLKRKLSKTKKKIKKTKIKSFSSNFIYGYSFRRCLNSKPTLHKQVTFFTLPNFYFYKYSCKIWLGLTLSASLQLVPIFYRDKEHYSTRLTPLQLFENLFYLQSIQEVLRQYLSFNPDYFYLIS